MQKLITAIRDGLVLLDLDARELSDIFARAVAKGVEQGAIPADLQSQVQQELLQRERKFSTAIGHAVAVPHAYLEGIPHPAIVFVRLSRPLNMGAPDGIPTRYLFLLTGPTGQAAEHLDTLTTIARLMSDDEFRYELGEAETSVDIVTALERFQARTAPSEPVAVAEPTPGLRYTGRIAGGLLADIRRRLPAYPGDFKDGLHPKTITATLFLYFACLAPAVTFGGLMYGETGGWIGAAEMLVATALCGTLFALIGGQPLIILGGTGPLLVFTGILYRLCDDLNIPFLATYAWVGLWTAVFTIALAVADASCLIRFFTRFTDEIFAALISIIFIVEALKSIVGYVQGAHAENLKHDVAFLSLLLALGTFIVAMILSRFRKSRYLQPAVREFLADFGPTLAVVLLLLFGAWFPNVKPEPLDVPETFGTSTPRSWLVNPTEAPMWVWYAAVGPALLATVLVYLDQNITARLINNRDHKLHKGEAYHLDLGVVGALIGLCSVLGLPWLVAATVRSLNHLRSLATVEEAVTRRGDRREQIIHVRETRVTGLAIHLLIAASLLLLLPLLQAVPKAVLYGLFLFMGVVSIAGNQFFQRVHLWLMDPALYPSTHYTRKVPLRTIHKFTLLQLGCLVVLWIVKVSPAGILFPMFIALLVPVRMLAGRYFKAEHLAALDAEELPEEEETEWV